MIEEVVFDSAEEPDEVLGVRAASTPWTRERYEFLKTKRVGGRRVPASAWAKRG
jgi:hypothetical protein